MLVGDLIMDLRVLGNDLPQTLPAPSGLSLIQWGAVPTLTFGSYYAVVTYFNAWGETAPSTELGPVVVDATHGLQIASGVLPAGVTKFRIYFGIGSGAENQYTDFTAFPAQISVPGTPQAPPVRSSAYLPDSDGGFLSASVAYRWLNEGLNRMSLATGGIQDWGGTNSISGQPGYVISSPIRWRKIDACWYDGWELEQGNKADIFRNRPLTASISRIFAIDQNSAQQVGELYYIPSRSGAVTTTAAPVVPTDTSIIVTSTIGFTGPPFGLLLLGSEIVAFNNITGTTITIGPRALGGTVSAINLAGGSTVKELNILWNGYRFANTYALGASTTTMDIPAPWESILFKYLLAKYREAEQNRQEAASLFKEFEAEASALARSNKQLSGPRQARMFDTFGFRGVVPASAGGGLIIR